MKTLRAIALFLVASLAFAQEFVVGDPTRFGEGAVADLLGMTYAQPVACSPALSTFVDGRFDVVACALHPGGEQMARAEIEAVVAARRYDEGDDVWDVSGDELLAGGVEYGYDVFEVGFVHVFLRADD
jgi:hypothetical protein